MPHYPSPGPHWGIYEGGVLTRKVAPYVGNLTQSDSSCQRGSISTYMEFVAHAPRDAPDAFFLDTSGCSPLILNGQSRQDYFGITEGIMSGGTNHLRILCLGVQSILGYFVLGYKISCVTGLPELTLSTVLSSGISS